MAKARLTEKSGARGEDLRTAVGTGKTVTEGLNYGITKFSKVRNLRQSRRLGVVNRSKRLFLCWEPPKGGLLG